MDRNHNWNQTGVRVVQYIAKFLIMDLCMYICNYNKEKTALHCVVFNRAIHSKCSNLENKIIFASNLKVNANILWASFTLNVIHSCKISM